MPLTVRSNERLGKWYSIFDGFMVFGVGIAIGIAIDSNPTPIPIAIATETPRFYSLSAGLTSVGSFPIFTLRINLREV